MRNEEFMSLINVLLDKYNKSFEITTTKTGEQVLTVIDKTENNVFSTVWCKFKSEK